VLIHFKEWFLLLGT